MTIHWALAGALGNLSPLLLGLFLAYGTCRAGARKCISFPAHGVLSPCSSVRTESSLRQSSYSVVILPALALVDRDAEGELWFAAAVFYEMKSSRCTFTCLPQHFDPLCSPLSDPGVHKFSKAPLESAGTSEPVGSAQPGPAGGHGTGKGWLCASPSSCARRAGACVQQARLRPRAASSG